MLSNILTAVISVTEYLKSYIDIRGNNKHFVHT